MDTKGIYIRIRKHRLENGLSQRELADRLNISQNSYHKLENGETMLISPRIKLLSSIFRVPEEELLLGYDPSTSNARHSLEEAKSDYQKQLNYKDKRIADLESMLKDKGEIIDHLHNELAKERRSKEENL